MSDTDFLRIGPGGEPLSPRQIVAELDQYVVGQAAAKRAVAIALRNRWRRQRVPDPLRQEILPNNILLIGPTGVGKTEIARRLARLAGAPFVKVEATKFTEVGYVGRDVDSIVRDLVEVALGQVKSEWGASVEVQARQRVEERLLDLLLPGEPPEPAVEEAERRQRTRDKLRGLLQAGALEERRVSVDVSLRGGPLFEIFSGGEELGVQMAETLGSMFPGRRKRQELPVREARPLLHAEEVEKLVDMEAARREALGRVETSGIVFLDEIDKIAAPRGESQAGPDVSRQGVQRDLLPLVEGTSVSTKHGVVRTDHVLFIAAGAFHLSKPSDLIPELQGRFPIRVELQSLGEDDFVRILTEPRNALVRQYAALLATEGCELELDPGAVREIARVAAEVNERSENIGARRLHTILTTLLDELLFELPDSGRQAARLDAAFVRAKLEPILRDEDLSRYIL